MGESTAITWCDHTFNPWWGCWKIAPECANCYADATAARYAPGHWGRTAPRRFFGDARWNEPRKWNRKAERDGVRRRVFVGSMCDWAEVHPDPAVNSQLRAARARLFALIQDCPSLDWLLLTKRPGDARDHVPWSHDDPWSHVWIGVSVGHRDSVYKMFQLQRIPAATRFVSCEPILEEISADTWDIALSRDAGTARIHWLIVGDESGHGARPANIEWVRTARDAAARHGVAFHFKQWCGADAPGIEGREAPRKKIHLPILDGRRWAEFPTVGFAIAASGSAKKGEP